MVDAFRAANTIFIARVDNSNAIKPIDYLAVGIFPMHISMQQIK